MIITASIGRLVLLFILGLSLTLACSRDYDKANKKDGKKHHDDENGLKNIKQSDSLSQLFRANAAHYWSWVKQQDQTYNFNGLVMGDAHLGNMHPFPGFRGKDKKMVWRNIDLDDAGVGPFIYDFLHYVISIKLIDKAFDISALTEAYIRGLLQTASTNSNSIKVPKALEEYLGLTEVEFREKQMDYIKRKTLESLFVLDQEPFEKYNAEKIGISAEQIVNQVKNIWGADTEVLDFATVKKEKGGSADLIRVYVLINLGSEPHIFEMKELVQTSLVRFQAQENIVSNFLKARDYFEYNSKDLAIFSLNDKNFLFREKKTTLYDVPYELKNKKDYEFFTELAIWGAFTLGGWHSGQTESASYAGAINSTNAAFLEFVTRLHDQYIAVLSATNLEK
jgi:hypothetical protein